MSKVSAFRSLMYTLSRIPGLSFLRGASNTAYKAENAKRQADYAKGNVQEMTKKDTSTEEKK
jgi:hypothetical protein